VEIHPMKKSLFALAALGAFAGVAHAQSSVTLYGIIDEGFNWTSNAGGKRLYGLANGNLSGSRWGLRGTEDLGGGLKAIFTLENGFNVNNGTALQGDRMFGRQAFFGLSSDVGAVTLGRQYDSVVDFVGQLAASNQWAGYIGAHPGDLDNFNNSQRTNNAIKFTSANYAGLTFGGLYSLGGIAGKPSQNQIWSVGAKYANGPMVLGAGYLNSRNPNASFYGGNSAAVSPDQPNLLPATASPVYSGYLSAQTLQIIGAGGAYTFGAATVGATYSNTKFMKIGHDYTAPAALDGKTATLHNAEVNFRYQLTPALLLGVAYDYTRSNKVGGQDRAVYHQGSIGADYLLSKRTDLYMVGTYQKASGTDSTGKAAVAAIAGVSPSSKNHQSSVRVGIRHRF
jgi:predicted porin